MGEYVIVGAGSAGCILAARLSEDPNVQVTLLEAGGEDNHLFYRMPAGYLPLMKSGRGNWAYESVAQPGLDGRTMYFPRGKVLGGSSAINGLVYVRGNSGDFDHWSQLGNRGWSNTDVLPSFRRLERVTNGDPYRGDSGLIGISIADRATLSPIGNAWLAAAEQAGFPFTPDYNGPQQEGFGLANANIANKRRQSAASTYLAATRDRPNLKVITGAHATAIRIEGGRATGVDYLRKGRLQTVSTSGEVILSGGAINSPQLLQLSGIGAAPLLAQHDIAVKADLPGVGANLQDHVAVMVKQEITKPYSALAYTRPVKSALALARFLLKGDGPAASNGLEVLAFLKSRDELSWPDIQYHFPMLLYEDHGRHIIQREGFSAYANVARPRSRGTVTIASADPVRPPRIDPAYFSDSDDLRVTRAAIRMARDLIAQPAFDDFRGPEYSPGADVTSDADLDAFIRATAMSVYHPVGTCRMGSDAMAVVDDRLRVHGVERLRVIDASVMPTIVSGNTNAATMMIAERAVELMQEGSG